MVLVPAASHPSCQIGREFLGMGFLHPKFASDGKTEIVDEVADAYSLQAVSVSALDRDRSIERRGQVCTNDLQIALAR